MRIYRLERLEANGESAGFEYHTSIKAVRRSRKELRSQGVKRTRLQQSNFPITREGILKALYVWGGHPDKE